MNDYVNVAIKCYKEMNKVNEIAEGKENEFKAFSAKMAGIKNYINSRISNYNARLLNNVDIPQPYKNFIFFVDNSNLDA